MCAKRIYKIEIPKPEEVGLSEFEIAFKKLKEKSAAPVQREPFAPPTKKHRSKKYKKKLKYKSKNDYED